MRELTGEQSTKKIRDLLSQVIAWLKPCEREPTIGCA